jgi:hypothetical protein
MFPEHDLKVYYPYGGRHYLLCWWTHNEQHHLIVAKTHESVEKSFATVLKAHADAEPRDFLQVDIVSPEQKYLDAYAKEQMEREVRTFWGHLMSTVREYREETGKIPSRLKRCTKYVDKYASENKAKEDEHHWDCENCCEGYLPVEGTFESVYMQYRDTYLELHDRSNSRVIVKAPPIREKKVKSSAPLQDTALPLYAITPNFGHHSHGIVMGSEVDVEEMTDTYLLFYQNPKPADRSTIDAACFVHKENLKAKDEARKNKWVADKILHQKERFDELFQFFGEP